MTDMFADLRKPQPIADKPSAPTPAPSPVPASPAGNKKFEYLHRGAFTMLKVNLDAGEQIKAESDAMVAMSANVTVEGKLEGGILGGIGRMFAGEKFFFQTLKSHNGPGQALLAPSTPGDIMELEMDGMNSYILQKDGFFAASDGVSITAKVQNLVQGLFSGEGFFVVKATGRGILFVSSYGSIHPLDLAPGEEFIVDNGHLVAWPDTMDYKIEKASAGWISSFTSGEGLVCRFRGPGRVLIQTRNPKGFGAWIRQFIPTKSSN